MDKSLQENNLQKTREITTYHIASNEHLSAAFSRIPSNANINKGRCGIGGTTMELNDNRDSIIIVPNISIIKNKKKELQNLYGIYGDISISEIEDYLKNFLSNKNKQYLKVMSTPDSFYKLIQASDNIGFDVRNRCFLLFDESHSVITEGTYRSNITKPFEHFFNFNYKSLISATPYQFSDPRFSSLESIEIISKPINDSVNILFSENVISTLKSIIEQTRKIENTNMHIFYNSVKGITDLINIVGDEGVSIYCADNVENRDKLGVHNELLCDVNEGDYNINKINLYTTKYYEGWDLKDENAIIVIASDVNLEHTCIGINNKAIQAFGRLRNKAKGLYHVTNVANSPGLKLNDEEIKEACKNEAERRIRHFNNSLEFLEFRDDTGYDIMSSIAKIIEKYSSIDNVLEPASLDYNKLDAEINNRISLSQYSNRESVIESWETSNFQTTTLYDQREMDKETKRYINSQKGSKKRKIKYIVERFYELDKSPASSKTDDGSIIYNFDTINEWNDLIIKNKELFNYYSQLKYEKIKELNFNLRKMRLAYIEQNASQTEVSYALKESIDECFKVGNFYPSHLLKSKIKEIYNSYNINKNVTAAYINKYYITDETTKRIGGNPVKGHLLKLKRI